jgi:hypothetical protein
MRDRRASCSRREKNVKHLPRALAFAVLLLWTSKASATTVAILSPPNPSADVTQALTLLRGELLSVGVEVTTLNRKEARGSGEAASVTWLEDLAAKGANAIIDPIGDDALEAVDVWVVKTSPQRFEVTHVGFDANSPRQPEILALRAVEALRAGFLQMDWAARKRRHEAVPEPPRDVVSPPPQVPRPTERVALEAGAAGMMSLDGVGPALLPTVRAGWAARPWLLLQASAAGLGTRPQVTTSAGSARVAQDYALLGARLRLRSDQRVWPFLGLAVGALHTSVDGETGLGTSGHTLGRWSALFDVSVGAGFRVHGRFFLTLAAHAQVAEPYAAIHILDTVAATSGRPNLLVTLTVGAWL